jgi:hypothetical protein
MLTTDGVLIREVIADADGIHGRLIQPTRDLVLQRNQELRKNPDALRKLEAMAWALSIPEVDYYHLRNKYPELKSPDALVRSLAWKAFIASAESVPYRVRDRVNNPA